MQNAIYFGKVTHHRLLPKQHKFTYSVGLLLLHLNNLVTDLNNLSCVSIEKINLLSFYRRNYLANYDGNILEAVSNAIRKKLEVDWYGEVYLLSHLAHCGYCYNPVSFYYCFNQANLEFIIAEIHNTPWGERYEYVLDCRNNNAPYRLQQSKQFHISPFMPMDINYEWQFSQLADKISITMHCYQSTKLIFNVVFYLERISLNNHSLSKYILENPLRTQTIHLRIYWQALKLWLKRMNFYTHPKKIRR